MCGSHIGFNARRASVRGARPNSQNAQAAIAVALHSAAGKPVDIDLTRGFRKIERVGLAGKDVTDLTPLTQLPNLKHLWVHNNRINDLTPVAQLKNLESLYLDHNKLRTLRRLANAPSSACCI